MVATVVVELPVWVESAQGRFDQAASGVRQFAEQAMADQEHLAVGPGQSVELRRREDMSPRAVAVVQVERLDHPWEAPEVPGFHQEPQVHPVPLLVMSVVAECPVALPESDLAQADPQKDR